jgi:hypothetical protein
MSEEKHMAKENNVSSHQIHKREYFENIQLLPITIPDPKSVINEYAKGRYAKKSSGRK